MLDTKQGFRRSWVRILRRQTKEKMFSEIQFKSTMCFCHSLDSLILKTNFTKIKKDCGKLVLVPETKY